MPKQPSLLLSLCVVTHDLQGMKGCIATLCFIRVSCGCLPKRLLQNTKLSRDCRRLQTPPVHVENKGTTVAKPGVCKCPEYNKLDDRSTLRNTFTSARMIVAVTRVDITTNGVSLSLFSELVQFGLRWDRLIALVWCLFGHRPRRSVPFARVLLTLFSGRILPCSLPDINTCYNVDPGLNSFLTGQYFGYWIERWCRLLSPSGSPH